MARLHAPASHTLHTEAGPGAHAPFHKSDTRPHLHVAQGRLGHDHGAGVPGVQRRQAQGAVGASGAERKPRVALIAGAHETCAEG
jgi:hypothetical protein